MSKSIKIVRTFPTAWYKFIVEGDTKSLPESERLIAESALTSAFPDGGDIIATKMMKGTQRFSSLVCESYSVQGMKEKSEGKTFKVKVLANEVKNPNTYKKYVSEGIEDLRAQRARAKNYVPGGDKSSGSAKKSQKASSRVFRPGEYEELSKRRSKQSKNTSMSIGGRSGVEFNPETDTRDEVGSRAEGDLSIVRRMASGSPDYADPGIVDVIGHSFDEWKKLFGTSLTGDEKKFVNGKSVENGVDGSKYEDVKDAASRLKKEIKKAFVADDTKRLEELRAVLPVLALDISHGFAVRSLLKVFLSNDATGNHNASEARATIVQNYIHTIAVVYNAAFGLPNVNPFGEQTDDPELTKRFTAVIPTNVTDVIGPKNNLFKLKEKLQKGEIERGEYADSVLGKGVFYGETYAEKSMGGVTKATLDTYGANARRERAEMNTYFKDFKEWFTRNAEDLGIKGDLKGRNINMAAADYNYGRIQFACDNIHEWADDISDDLTKLPDIDGAITIDKLIDLYGDVAESLGESCRVNEADDDADGDDSEENAKPESKKTPKRAPNSENRLRLFKGVLAKVWENRGLSCEWKNSATLVSSEPFNGTMDEFKDEATNVCDEIGNRADTISESLKHDYEEYLNGRTQMMKDIRAKKKDFAGKYYDFNFQVSPTFSDGEHSGDYFADVKQVTGNDNLAWLKSLISTTYWQSLTSSKLLAMKSLAGFKDARTGETGLSGAQSDFVTFGNRHVGDEDIGGDPAKQEMIDDQIDNGERTSDDVETDAIANGASTGVDFNRDVEIVDRKRDFNTRCKEFVNSSQPQVRNMAEYLHINKSRAVMLHKRFIADIGEPDVIGTQLGMMQYRGDHKTTIKNQQNAIDAEIKEIEKSRKEELKQAKKAVSDAKKAKAEKSEIEELEREVKRLTAAQKVSAAEKAEITRKHVGDVNLKDDVYVRKSSSEFTDGGFSQANKELQSLMIELSNARTAYNKAKKSSDHEQMVSLGEKIDTLDGEVERMKKEQGITSPEMSVSAAKSGDDFRNQMLRDHFSYIWWDNDDEAKTDDANGSTVDAQNTNAYRKLPDLLLLLAYDDIVDYVDAHKNQSFESCVYDVGMKLRPSYLSFMDRLFKFHNYASLGMASEYNESVGNDKYLASVEALIDLIENSEADAQQKLDMLEVVTTGFQAWCEQNEIVPEEVNPEEDPDAVANHPEDDETADADDGEEDK